MTWEIFKIHRGKDEIDLVDENGWWLLDWEPQIGQLEDGGIWADNKSTGGRQPAFGIYGNVVEPMVFGLSGASKSAVDAQIGQMLDMLDSSFFYWVKGSKQTDIVYLEVKEQEWETSRYAPLCYGNFPNLPEIQRGNYETGVIVNGRSRPVGISTIQLDLERKDWSDQIPGNGDCVEIGNEFVWLSGLSEVQVLATTRKVFALGFDPITGDMYAGEEGDGVNAQIWKSTDGGENWVSNLNASPVQQRNIFGFLPVSSGTILSYGQRGSSGARTVIRTTNQGGSWSDVSHANMNRINRVIETSGGSLIAVGYGDKVGPVYLLMWRSVDDGQTWTSVYSGDLFGVIGNNGIVDIIEMPNGNLLATSYFTNLIRTYISTDDGQNWSLGATIPVTSPVEAILRPSAVIVSGNVLILTDDVYQSLDSGVSWSKIYEASFPFLGVITVSDTIYALTKSEPQYLAKSVDGGFTWQFLTSKSPLNPGLGNQLVAYNTDNGRIFYSVQLVDGVTCHVYYLDSAFEENTLGHSPTCNDEIVIGNKSVNSSLTHIFISDGGVFSEISIPNDLPFDLLPASMATNDALYLGQSSSILSTGPFDGLVFNITPAIGTLDIAWEYYNGSWVSLTVHDETNNFRSEGVKVVTWTRQSDWTTTTINGILGYWVRARVDSISGSTAPPEQIDQQIYLANYSRVSIDSDQILGRTGAFGRVILVNRSDEDGPGGVGPNLYANRIVVGLHSRNDDDKFVSHINLANEQNPDGISMGDLGPFTLFVSEPRAPAGEVVEVHPAGASSMTDRITVSLSSGIARSFYGSFHVYLRGYRTGGAAADISVRLSITSGSGGLSFQTVSRRFKTTSMFEVLDFGEITLPVGGGYNRADLGDVTEIKIQVSSSATLGVEVGFIDLVFIHVDEWFGNFIDESNNGYSDIGKSRNIQKMLDIDSISDPKEDIKARVKTVDNGLITSHYNSACVGPVLLQTRASQELWFLAMQTSQVGDDYAWLSPPEICHSVRVFYSSRYRSVLS